MYKYLTITACLLLTLLLSSCSTDISSYKDQSPTFDIQEYFNGDIIAWGMIQDYSTKVNRRFCVEIDASWEGPKGTLEEVFYFDDGEISHRTWRLDKLNDGAYKGTAGDVVGIAKGQQSGFAFQWQYKLSVPIDDSVYEFDMDDWMYQVDEFRVFNKTGMSKLGVKVAEITLFFDKQIINRKCNEFG